MTEEKQPVTENWGMQGHDWAVDLLRQQIAHDAIRHAYLFTGPAGVGRRTLALRFTQALSCPTPVAPGVPCRACRTCKQIEAMQYSDLMVVQAEKEGGVLSVEKVRAIRQSLVLMPYQGKYRVALFLRFQEANVNAANALLKTLEEAPPHDILVLTADNAEQLLPTIVSRCEILRLRPLPMDDIEARLIQDGVDKTQAHLLGHLSGGCPGIASRLRESSDTLNTRSEDLDLLHSLSSASRIDKFAEAGRRFKNNRDMEKQKVLFRALLLTWLSFWRDVLVNASGSNAPMVNVDQVREIENWAASLGMTGARRMVEVTEHAVEQLDGSVNARLLAEVVFLDIPKRKQ